MPSDLPEQYLLQQSSARPVSGEELETLGKRAAAGWRAGEHETLTAAVVETVKHGHLSPEQVRRVVEFTNQDAYLTEFRKEGRHKVIHFDCGPADPSQVLNDLNDGGGGSVFDSGDYRHAPSSFSDQFQQLFDSQMGKTASAAPSTYNPYEEVLLDWFKAEPEKVAAHDPTREPRELWQKLSSARDEVAGDLDRLEIDFHDVGQQMFEAVKQASRAGVPLGDVVQAWSVGNPEPEFIKAAFQSMAQGLRGELGGFDAVGASLEKRGSLERAVDETHPVVESFRGFCEVLNKLAGLRSLKQELDEACAQTLALMKAAALGGAVGKAWQGLGHAGEAVGEAVAPVAEALVGANPETVKRVARKGIQYGGAGAGLLAANAAQQEVTDRPIVRSTAGAAKSMIPGTQEYNYRRARIMSGGMY
jgi:hypothetical protein